MNLTVGFDAKRAFNNTTGLGNYSRFVLNSLQHFAPSIECLAYTPRLKKGLYDDFPEKKIRQPLLSNSFYGAWWRSVGIKNDLLRDKIQIFHGLSNELPFGLKQSGVRSVVTIHDLIFLRYPSLYPAIDRFFYQQKFKRACREADVIVAVSQQTKNDIVAFYGIAPDRIEVVYQDCHDIFRASKEVALKPTLAALLEGNPYLLSVGTIEERKNQLRLVEAFHKAALPEAILVLVGRKTPYQQQIEAYILRNGLRHRVKILNDVAFDDLPALYRHAKAFVYVSLFEGFGIPIVEALHSGVPVVAATGSCLEEAGGEGAIYTNPTDTDDLADKLTKIWNDENLRLRLIAKGRQHVRRFSAQNIAQQLSCIYQTLH
ncbi:MAG: glycosyltransferase family 4 protein [Runella sp.]